MLSANGPSPTMLTIWNADEGALTVTVRAPPVFTTAPFSGETICNRDSAGRVAAGIARASHRTDIAGAIDLWHEPLINEWNRCYSCSKAVPGQTHAPARRTVADQNSAFNPNWICRGGNWF